MEANHPVTPKSQGEAAILTTIALPSAWTTVVSDSTEILLGTKPMTLSTVNYNQAMVEELTRLGSSALADSLGTNNQLRHYLIKNITDPVVEISDYVWDMQEASGQFPLQQLVQSFLSSSTNQSFVLPAIIKRTHFIGFILTKNEGTLALIYFNPTGQSSAQSGEDQEALTAIQTALEMVVNVLSDILAGALSADYPQPWVNTLSTEQLISLRQQYAKGLEVPSIMQHKVVLSDQQQSNGLDCAYIVGQTLVDILTKRALSIKKFDGISLKAYVKPIAQARANFYDPQIVGVQYAQTMLRDQLVARLGTALTLNAQYASQVRNYVREATDQCSLEVNLLAVVRQLAFRIDANALKDVEGATTEQAAINFLMKETSSFDLTALRDFVTQLLEPYFPEYGDVIYKLRTSTREGNAQKQDEKLAQELQAAEYATFSHLPGSFALEIGKTFPAKTLLKAKLPHAQTTEAFEEHTVKGDGDCGFTALATDRKTVATQLRTLKENAQDRAFLAEEIGNAFTTYAMTAGQEGLAAPDPLTWNKLLEQRDGAQQQLDQSFSKIRTGLDDKQQQLSLDTLITWLHNHQQLEEAAILQQQRLSVFQAESALETYCKQADVFAYYMDALENSGLWLGYKSALLYARQANIALYIWRKEANNPQQLALIDSHSGQGTITNEIHMLHTAGFTHFNLLSKPAVKTTEQSASNLLAMQKSQGHHGAFSLTESLGDRYPTALSIQTPSIQKIDPAATYPFKNQKSQASLQPSTSVPLSWQGLRPETQTALAELKSHQALADPALTAKVFRLLAEDYLQQGQYHYACGLYNYLLHLEQSQCSFDSDNNNVSIQASSALINKLQACEDGFLISIKRDPAQNPHPYSQCNAEHRRELKELREWCKIQLAKIDSEYSFDIYDEEKMKGREAEAHQLQLKKAEAIRDLYHEIAKTIKTFIRELVKECIGVLGEPLCEYTILGLGSLAREEATPYSDLEFAILIAEEYEDYKIYFRNLTKLLHLKTINLGETILPSLGIPALNDYQSNNSLNHWFFDTLTPRGFAFDGSMPQACKTPLGNIDYSKNRYDLVIMYPNVKEYAQQLENWKHTHKPNSILFIFSPTALRWTAYLAKNEKENFEEKHIDTGSDFNKELQRINHENVAFYNKKPLITLLQKHTLFETLTHYELIHTPEEMVQYIGGRSIENNEELDWIDVKPHLSMILTTTGLIGGSEELFSRYQIEVQKALLQPNKLCGQPQHQLFALHMLIIGDQSDDWFDKASEGSIKFKGDLMEFRLPLGIHDEGKLYDVKKEIYRLSDRVLERLAIYYNIHRTTVWERLEALRVHDYLPLNGVEHLKIACSIAMELRLRAYLMHGGQYDIMHIENLLGVQKDDTPFLQGRKFYLPNKAQLFRFYYTALPFHATIERFCKERTRTFDQLSFGHYEKSQTLIEGTFFNNDLRTQARIHLRLLQYRLAQESLEKAIIETPYDIFAINNLCSIYLKLGKIDLAIDHYERVLNDERLTTIPAENNKNPNNNNNNQSVNTSLIIAEQLMSHLHNNLGLAYYQSGQIDKAIEYYEKALAYDTKNHNDKNLITDLINLGLAYTKMSNNRAINCFQEALPKAKNTYGDKHPIIAIILNNLGYFYHCYSDQSNLAKAIDCYEQALTIKKKVYGDIHPEVSLTLNNLAEAYRLMGQSKKAIEYLWQVFSIETRIYANFHPNVARCLNNLGLAYSALGQFLEAIQFHQQALIIEQVCGGHTPGIIKCLINLGLAYYHNLALNEQNLTNIKKQTQAQPVKRAREESPSQAVLQPYPATKKQKVSNGNLLTGGSIERLALENKINPNLFQEKAINDPVTSQPDQEEIGEELKQAIAMSQYTLHSSGLSNSSNLTEIVRQLGVLAVFAIDQPHIQYHIACCYHIAALTTGNPDLWSGANYYFQQALSHQFDSGIATEYGLFLCEQQQYEEAIFYFVQALELADTSHVLSASQLQPPRLPQPLWEDYYTPGTISLTVPALACYGLFIAYNNTQQFNEAKALMQKAIALSSPLICLLLGHACRVIGRYAEAIELFKQASNEEKYAVLEERHIAHCMTLLSAENKEKLQVGQEEQNIDSELTAALQLSLRSPLANDLNDLSLVLSPSEKDESDKELEQALVLSLKISGAVPADIPPPLEESPPLKQVFSHLFFKPVEAEAATSFSAVKDQVKQEETDEEEELALALSVATDLKTPSSPGTKQ